MRAELGTNTGTAQPVELQLGLGVQSVRSWVRQADINDGLMGLCRVKRFGRNSSFGRGIAGTRSSIGLGVSSGGATARTTALVDFVNRNKDDVVEGSKLDVELICRDLQVAPSTHFAARDRAPSVRTRSDAVMSWDLYSL